MSTPPPGMPPSRMDLLLAGLLPKTKVVETVTPDGLKSPFSADGKTLPLKDGGTVTLVAQKGQKAQVRTLEYRPDQDRFTLNQVQSTSKGNQSEAPDPRLDPIRRQMVQKVGGDSAAKQYDQI